MKIDDIRPVQSVERTATTDRQLNDDSSGSTQAKPRNHFSRVFGEDDGVVYRVVDEDTGIILTQVPSEEVLRVAKHLQQILSDRKAK